MKRMSAYFLPVLAALATMFGFFYIYAAIRPLRTGDTGTAVFLLVFGFGGVALGVALWTTWRKFAIARRERTSPAE
jgi:hypothetical protein